MKGQNTKLPSKVQQKTTSCSIRYSLHEVGLPQFTDKLYQQRRTARDGVAISFLRPAAGPHRKSTHKSRDCRVKSMLIMGSTTPVGLLPRCREGMSRQQQDNLLLQNYHQKAVLMFHRYEPYGPPTSTLLILFIPR